jgi:hypothetical protein
MCTNRPDDTAGIDSNWDGHLSHWSPNLRKWSVDLGLTVGLDRSRSNALDRPSDRYGCIRARFNVAFQQHSKLSR